MGLRRVEEGCARRRAGRCGVKRPYRTVLHGTLLFRQALPRCAGLPANVPPPSHNTVYIDWTHFTPGPAVAGGLLIGLASALYLLGNGRIAGIAGIVASPLRALVSRSRLAPEQRRLVFIAGLLAASWA